MSSDDLLLTWVPGPRGCFYLVDLRNESTGAQRQLYAGLGASCTLPLDLLDKSTPMLYRVRMRGAEESEFRTLLDFRRLPDPGEEDLNHLAGAVLLDVPDGTKGADRHRLVVRCAETHELALDLRADRRRFRFGARELRSCERFTAQLSAWSEDGWVNASPWWEVKAGGEIGRVSTEHAAANLLGALTSGNGAEPPRAILDFTVEADGEPAHLHHLTAFLLRVWKRMIGFSGGVSLPMLEDLAQRSAKREREISRHVRTTLEYLSLWVEADRYFTDKRLRGAGYREIVGGRAHIVALQKRIESRALRLSTSYGALMLEGMLTSADDRDGAAELFRAAKAEEPEFAAASPLDFFASTYFTAEEVGARANEIAARRTLLMESFELLGEPPQGGGKGTLLLFSCDPRFFAIYFPYWASTAEYLRTVDVHLHFVLVGGERATAVAFERGREFGGAVSRLRGSSSETGPENLSFSRVAAPRYVEDPTTLFACARYLLAREVARRFGGQVLILDMDMTMKENPADFHSRLASAAGARLPVVVASGLPSLIPARRYLAGTFVVPDAELGDEAMRHLEDYIYAGLSCPTSWTLDQNALDYAVQLIDAAHGPEALLDIGGGGFKRPFAQEPVNLLYERAQPQTESS